MLTEELATTYLGWPGAMISPSKSGYINRYPEKFPVFNANVCIKSAGKIWFGDLELQDSKDKLLEMAAKFEEDVFILREHDARFENEENPRYDDFVVKFSADGTITIGEMYKGKNI